jgi:hypothetical protein
MTNFLFVEIGTSVTSPKEFAVKIDDRGKLYIKSLVELVEKHVSLRKRAIKNLEVGDFVVFTKKDIYVEDNPFALVGSDLKVLSLVNDHDKVLSYVRNFFKSNNLKKKTSSIYNEIDLCDVCPFSDICGSIDNNIIRDGEFINVEEKVTIQYNSVKVGYDLYRIYSTRFGKKYVNIEGQKFEVKNDYMTGKYLQLV